MVLRGWKRFVFSVERATKRGGYLRALALPLVIFFVGLEANFYAISFATEHMSNSVTDIILSNTPVFDVDYLFVYGTFFMIGATVLIAFWKPQTVPFVFAAIGIFLLIRSVFVSLTHIAPFEPHISDEFGRTINRLFFGGDRFFSGHTGLPFLGALVFWKYARIRFFYLLLSAFFAVVVFMGHLHYSIDVLSAYFITYTIYHITVYLFPREFARFHHVHKSE